MHLNWLRPAFELKHSITYTLHIDCNVFLTRILNSKLPKVISKNFILSDKYSTKGEREQKGQIIDFFEAKKIERSF